MRSGGDANIYYENKKLLQKKKREFFYKPINVALNNILTNKESAKNFAP